jgi:ribosomal protein S18 acetylase RimI-like enzyme
MNNAARDPIIRCGRASDIPALLELMERLYVEDGSVPLRRETHRRATEELLDAPNLGQIYVIDVDEEVVGYAVLTWGYSLEDGGRHGLLDELYVASAYRRRGLAHRLLAELEKSCRQNGARTIHLLVERSNEDARRIYLNHGFTSHERDVLMKWLSD